MELQIKTKTGEKVVFKMSTPVSLLLISIIATGISALVF